MYNVPKYYGTSATKPCSRTKKINSTLKKKLLPVNYKSHLHSEDLKWYQYLLSDITINTTHTVIDRSFSYDHFLHKRL